MSKSFRQILILVETSNEFGREILRGVMQYVRLVNENGQNPWRVKFEYRGPFDGLPLDFESWSGDGILSRCNTTELYRQLQTKHVPIVELLNNEVPGGVAVESDNNLTAQLAMNHFCERGLQNIGFYAYGNTWWVDRRREAFEDALAEKNIRCYVSPDALSVDNVPQYSRWEERYQKSMIKWLKRLPLPIGIWAASDMQALRLMQTCQEIGLKIPEEVAILGASNDALLCNLLTPQLSSIALNAEQMGFKAAELLDKKIDKFQKDRMFDIILENAEPIKIPPKGVIARQSTDMISASDPDCVRAMQYIRKNYTGSITVATVAQQVKLSRSTLDRRFCKSFGRTVDKEIFRLRMELVENLLLQSDLSINVISARAGFSCYEYFFRAFKRSHGITPQQYREHNS